MTGELTLRLLGGLEITLGGVPLPPSLRAKARALVCYLAATGRPHSRDALAALFWGELPEADARNNLRVVLSNLNRCLGHHMASPAPRSPSTAAGRTPWTSRPSEPAFNRRSEPRRTRCSAGRATRSTSTGAISSTASTYAARRRSRSGCSGSASGCDTWRPRRYAR